MSGLGKAAAPIALTLAAALLGVTPRADAQTDRSMRCGTYLIYGGGGKEAATMYEVLKKCGEPDAKTGYTWIYTHGNVQRMLTFNHQSRVLRIETRRN